MYFIYFVIILVILFFALDWIIENNFTIDKNIKNIIRNYHNTSELNKINLPSPVAPSGISMIINDDQIKDVALSIICLREVGYNSNICICYYQDELASKSIDFLKTIDHHLIIKSIDNFTMSSAIIASPFDKVLLIKPGIIFAKSPEYLFTQNTVFWKDKSTTGVLDKMVYNWVKKIIPYRIGDNRILNKESGSYQSGDLILFNKSTNMGTLRYLQILTEVDTGMGSKIPEKELFWIACELARENYYFIEYPGAIGELFAGNLCGHILYTTENGEMLCWTGGIGEFTHYSAHSSDIKWNVRGCLYGGEFQPISNNLKNVINRYLYLLHSINEAYLKNI